MVATRRGASPPKPAPTSCAVSSASGSTRWRPPAARPSSSSSRCGCAASSASSASRTSPSPTSETRQLALRNWSEELRLVDNVILRVVHLCTAILTEEQVNLTRFDQYLESYLKKDDTSSIPTSRSCCASTTPEAGLTLLREAFEDLHLVLTDLVKLSRIPYATFTAVGKILYREIRRSTPPRPPHRQEVQAHPRPHHQPRDRGGDPGDRGRAPSGSTRPRSSWSSSASSTTWSTPTPSGPTRRPSRTPS